MASVKFSKWYGCMWGTRQLEMGRTYCKEKAESSRYIERRLSRAMQMATVIGNLPEIPVNSSV